MHRKLLALLFILSLMLSNSYGTLFANEMSTINNTLQIAGFPFSDDFEKVELGPDWSTNTLNGVVEINTAHPYSGTRSVFLGQKVDGSATASLILAIDLTEQTDVYLDFWARLQGRAIAKVSISADEGANWEDIHDLSQNSESFGHEILDIAKEADANNLQLNDQFRIRFLFVNGNGNSNKANDGLTIDDLRLTQQAQVIATFPFAQATFETKTFPQGLYPQSLLNGVVEINTAHPYSGTRSVFLGQRVDGSATASLILMIDLTGQTDVYLDFWARLQGRAIAKVFISGDGGTTWKMVRDLSQSSESFGHEILDIAKEADANNLLLTDQFRILFSFYNGNGNSIKANDGLTIDDLRLTQQAQVIATFPFEQNGFETGIFPQGLYPQSLNNGVTEINTAHAYGGTHSAFLGQKVDGSATASLILMIDLTGQTDVYLDFWARLQGRAIAKVFISGDGGTTWKMVRDLSQSSESFGHEILDIAKEADANNPLLTDQFRILFSFVNGNGNSNKANDGLTVDDLRIGSTNPDTGLKAYLPLVTR